MDLGETIGEKYRPRFRRIVNHLQCRFRIRPKSDDKIVQVDGPSDEAFELHCFFCGYNLDAWNAVVMRSTFGIKWNDVGFGGDERNVNISISIDLTSICNCSISAFWSCIAK